MVLDMLGMNAAFLSPPPNAAFAYASFILAGAATLTAADAINRMPPDRAQAHFSECQEEIAAALYNLDADARNAIELQALVLGTLLAKDAPEELIVLAVRRLGEVANSSGISGMGSRGSTAAVLITETRARARGAGQ